MEPKGQSEPKNGRVDNEGIDTPPSYTSTIGPTEKWNFPVSLRVIVLRNVILCHACIYYCWRKLRNTLLTFCCLCLCLANECQSDISFIWMHDVKGNVINMLGKHMKYFIPCHNVHIGEDQPKKST